MDGFQFLKQSISKKYLDGCTFPAINPNTVFAFSDFQVTLSYTTTYDPQSLFWGNRKIKTPGLKPDLEWHLVAVFDYANVFEHVI